ncbi:uncharacterized protein [Dermacentor albipictus]|uniref:uncharacterized protein n=1 Tax=Dermacentor albipictus TaxID=60249 RepID=UPI0031FE1B90
MAEVNITSGMLAAHLLRGRGARRSGGGNDQRSRGQDPEDERGIPMASRGYVPPPGTPPPPYHEVLLAVPTEEPFSDDELALAARHILGYIRQLQQKQFPEREGRWIDDADEQAARRHYGWDRWFRRSFMQWKQHYVLLAPTKDLPYEKRA